MDLAAAAMAAAMATAMATAFGGTMDALRALPPAPKPLNPDSSTFGRKTPGQ
jgi:hypothetical protein